MQLTTALQKRGYELIVVTSRGHLDPPDEAQYKGIPVYRFPFQAVLLRRDLNELKAIRQQVTRLKQTFKPDLIHINSGQPSIFFHEHTEAAHLASTLVTIHSPLTHVSGHNTLLGRVLLSAHWVTTVSAAILTDIRQLVPEITPCSSIIYNGLAMPSLQPAPLSFGAPRLLCLGRVVADKGFDLALAAFASLIDRFPHARLVIAGDGPARPDLERQAAELGLIDAVEFTGWVIPEKVPELINTATLVIMPSRWREPFGLVALQAAQMARPTVAARVGGLPEIVVHQQTGLLVEKENSTALAESIAFLLEHPGVATQMGLAARKRAQKAFGLERFVDAYDALYQKLVQEFV